MSKLYFIDPNKKNKYQLIQDAYDKKMYRLMTRLGYTITPDSIPGTNYDYSKTIYDRKETKLPILEPSNIPYNISNHSNYYYTQPPSLIDYTTKSPMLRKHNIKFPTFTKSLI